MSTFVLKIPFHPPFPKGADNISIILGADNVSISIPVERGSSFLTPPVLPLNKGRSEEGLLFTPLMGDKGKGEYAKMVIGF